MTTEKIWREYLEACGYEMGDYVMGMDAEMRPVLQPTALDINGMAGWLALVPSTPLRIFTADGKTQKGPDFSEWIKGRRGRQEQIVERLMEDFTRAYAQKLAGDILRICGVEDGD